MLQYFWYFSQISACPFRQVSCNSICLEAIFSCHGQVLDIHCATQNHTTNFVCSKRETTIKESDHTVRICIYIHIFFIFSRCKNQWVTMRGDWRISSGAMILTETGRSREKSSSRRWNARWATTTSEPIRLLMYANFFWLFF